jgi:poly(3-hydroxybutyrate) depolymerase
MLQIVDEFDDAFGVLRHGCSGLVAEIGELWLAGLGIGAAVAGPLLGAQPVLIAAAAVVANLAALLKIRGSRSAARR